MLLKLVIVVLMLFVCLSLLLIYVMWWFCRKTVADTSEEEGPFLPRPAPTAPYPYGSAAVYGQGGPDYIP